MSERRGDLSDEALARRLATELPRYPAPPRLRAAVRATLARRPRVDWLAPAFAAAATALVFTLAVLPSLPRTGPDPVHRLVRAVVAEHTRAVLWGARRPDVIPAALPWLTQESGIDLRSVFSGDEHLTLLGAEPVYIEQRRGLAVHYRDADGHHLTYTVLPAPGLTLPERRRVPMGRWRPALLREGDFSVVVWKHGDLACFLVSDLVSEADVARLKEYFVRVRGATEPVPAY